MLESFVPENPPSPRELVSGTSGEEGIESLSLPLLDQPIALRKTARKISVPERLKDYVGYKHDLAKFC